MSVTVTLTPTEMARAAKVGTKRYLEALRLRKRDSFGAKVEYAWALHILGAAGELAAANAMGREWDAPINTFKEGGDVGDIQVRTRSKAEYSLIVRPGDRDHDVFVLVRAVKPPHFDVVGWMLGKDAKQRKWSQNYGNRAPAYFPPDGALKQISDLENAA